MNNSLDKVQAALADYTAEDGCCFSVTATTTDDISMLTIIREDIEEFAILATASETQLLFNVALFDEGQIIAGQTTALNKMMLELNMAMPLSSFAITGRIYSIFGAMSAESDARHIQEEILVLSENILDALEVCQNYLIPA
ncbi:MAG: DUF2170 family protein [Methylococcales bacterium]|nr:DUF2170 family protein [Methylococcales bacterium]